MSRIKEYRAARRALEDAAAGLMDKARQFTEGVGGWRARELFEAGREYGRAFNRVEHMRGRK